MLRRARDLVGFRIHATDGDIGHVRDLYFDDEHWLVRHVVVDTGHWLPGRQVLVAPRGFVGVDWARRRLVTPLTREQVRTSAPTTTDGAVTPAHVIAADAYVSMLFFWNDGDLLRLLPTAVTPAAHREALHLYSARGIVNYRVRAVDGEVGHVSDLQFDDGDWTIDSIVVDRRRWRRGRQAVVPSAAVVSISWIELTVHLRVSAEAVGREPSPDRNTLERSAAVALERSRRR